MGSHLSGIGSWNSTLAIFLDTRLRSETLHTWQAPDMESGYEAFSQNMGLAYRA